MNDRLEEVNSYQLFDTPPEKELDDITELASIICGTPISLITILDDKRQWFKSNKGLAVSETNIEDSFCQHALHKPHEVLVVNDALKDQRFIANKLVLEDPNIRFYAGAPLTTKNNIVLGTLCIIDTKPRELSKDQERALQILAQKAMDKIETLKLVKNLNTTIDINTKRLIKLTENLPIGIFEMVVSQTGEVKFSFLSKGIRELHPDIDLDDLLKDATVAFSLMHPDDIEGFQNALALSVEKEEKFYHEFRVKRESGFDWHAISGKPSKIESGETIIHGSFTDVTHHFEYVSALEQISFDISHVLRRPVTSMLGIMNLIDSEQELSLKKLKEYSAYIKIITKELEEFTRNLNDVYSEKKQKITTHNNGYKK